MSGFARLFGKLEALPGLESLSDGIARALTPVTKQRALMDVLHGRWIGHAIHPALSDLPIGLWSGASLLDLCGDEQGATVMTAAGCASAVATAATGTADWSVTAGRDRRLALVHGLANSAVLGIQIGALVARVRGHRRLGQLLGAAGLGSSAAAAYVGGELVFGRELMVDHGAFTAGPSKWTRYWPMRSCLTERSRRSMLMDARCCSRASTAPSVPSRMRAVMLVDRSARERLLTVWSRVRGTVRDSGSATAPCWAVLQRFRSCNCKCAVARDRSRSAAGNPPDGCRSVSPIERRIAKRCGNRCLDRLVEHLTLCHVDTCFR